MRSARKGRAQLPRHNRQRRRQYRVSCTMCMAPLDRLDAKSRATFPSWFLQIECDRFGKVRVLNEAHVSELQRRTRLNVFLERARHEGCGGGAGRVELLTGIEGVSSRPVRRIVLRGG